MNIRSFKSTLLASVTLGAMQAMPAYAQDAPAAEESAADDQAPGVTPQEAATQEVAAEEAADIVVTGTLIRNPNIESSIPVIATTSEEIELKQSNTAEQVVRELPGIVANMGSQTNNGNTGVTYVDLRGLGANRNLVLLDGKRIVPDDATVRTDLNSIPLSLVQRVDALTGAAVTTYGADAITGVVNFITKRNFEGFELLASNQITEKGDGRYLRVDATIGGDFADGRGNAVISLGYQDSKAIYQGARKISLFSINSYNGLEEGSGTSIPSRISGTRPLLPGTTTPDLNPATPNGPVRQINDPALSGDPRQGAAIGNFHLFNFNPYNIFQTPFTRYNVYGAAHYEVSDAVEVYARGMYAKNRTQTIIAPSGSFGQRVTINLNNPFLPQTLRNQLCAFNVAPVVDGRQTTYVPRFTTAECTAAAAATGRSDPNYREVDVNLSRRSVEYGPRLSTFTLDAFDVRGGLRGALTSTLNWDVNASYGQSDNEQVQDGYVLLTRLRQAALVEGTAADPRCQVDSDGCLPVDIFSPQGWDPATRDFVTGKAWTFRGAKLTQVQGLITGDMGITMPAASNPVGVAFGAEYRKHYGYQDADALARNPGELGGAGGAVLPYEGGYSVVEGYAEIIAPIVEDRDFFQSLTLEGGLRYSDYKVDAPNSPTYNTWTYKVGANWEPTRDIKLRANYNRAARAPNIQELFDPIATGLTNLAVDPCAGQAPVLNATLRAVCLAQGAPASSIGSIDHPSAAQANITTEGNLNLKPEKATTWTVGAVFTPSFLPGFNLSIDYYNIKVKDAITNPLPGDLINACFSPDRLSATNPDCLVIRRDPLTGGLDGDPGDVPGLYTQTTNQGKLATDGIDLIANYRRDVGFGKLNLSFVGNWTNSSKFKASEFSVNRECAGHYSVNCSFTGSLQPKLQFSQRSTLTMGKVDLSLLWRWIDKMTFDPVQMAEDVALAEFFPDDCPDPLGEDPGGCVAEPEFRKIKSHSYFDFTVRVEPVDNLTFTFTALNIFDKKPPLVGNTIGVTTFNSGNTYPSTYDALGRRYAVSAKLKF